MFFSLSKIFWFVFAPLNLIAILLFSGALIGFFNRALGRSISFLGIFIFLVFAALPTGTNMLALLENAYERPATLPDRIAGIIVMGGAFDTDITAARQIATIRHDGMRVIEGIRLAERYPDALLVFAGGSGRLVRNDRTEADDTKLFLSEQDFPLDNVIFEDESRNSYENIHNVVALLHPQPNEKWIIVTSAYHMPRVAGIIRHIGWQENVIFWPTDHRTTGAPLLWPQHADFIRNLNAAHIALREYAGLIAYHFTGKISSPGR